MSYCTKDGRSDGCKGGVELDKKENMTQGRVLVETDNLTVVQFIRSPLSMLSYFGSIISDCKSLLQCFSVIY